MSEPQFDIPHRCSRYLQWAYLLLALLLGGLVVWLGGDLWLRVLLLLLVAVSVHHMWRQVAFLRALTRIQLHQQQLFLVLNNEKIAVKRVGQSVVSGHWVMISCRVLPLQPRWRSPIKHLVVLPDSMSAEDHRRLRMVARADKL